MRFRALSFAFVLASSTVQPACTRVDPDSLRWWLAPEFDAERRRVFQEQLDVWNDVSERQQTIVEDESEATHRAYLRFAIPKKPQARGLYLYSIRTMLVQDDVDAWTYRMVVAHEQGHALGLGFDASGGTDGHPGGNAIMNIDGLERGSPVYPTPIDMKECRRVGACG